MIPLFLACALSLRPSFMTVTFLKEYEQLHLWLDQTSPGHEWKFVPPEVSPPEGPRWKRLPLLWKGHTLYHRERDAS